MNQFAFPYAFLLILLPFVWRFLWPAAKGLHGDALKIPFIKDLEKISIKSGALWQMGASTEGYRLRRLNRRLPFEQAFLVAVCDLGLVGHCRGQAPMGGGAYQA